MSKKAIVLILIVIVIIGGIVFLINQKEPSNDIIDITNIEMEEGKEIIEKNDGVYDIVDSNTNEIIFQNLTKEEMVIFEQDPLYNPDPNY